MLLVIGDSGEHSFIAQAIPDCKMDVGTGLFFVDALDSDMINQSQNSRNISLTLKANQLQ